MGNEIQITYQEAMDSHFLPSRSPDITVPGAVAVDSSSPTTVLSCRPELKWKAVAPRVLLEGEGSKGLERFKDGLQIGAAVVFATL